MSEPVTVPIAEAARRERAKSDRTTLMSWLRKIEAAFQQGFVLFSREPEKYMWEQTGFLVRKGTEFCIKIGEHAYQPIGQMDDEYFYPSQASLLIWCRDFAMSKPEAIAPAFVAKPLTQADLHDPENPNALIDRERAALIKGFEEIKAEVTSLSIIMDEGDYLKIQEGEYRLIETLKMAAISSRVLDQRIRKFAVDNPELATRDADTNNITGFNFSQETIKPLDLAKLISEFIRLKLNDDAARRFVKSNELVPTESETIEQIVAASIATLQAYLPGEGKAFDADGANRVLNNTRATLPVIGPAIEPFANTTDLVGALNAAIAALQQVQALQAAKTVAEGPTAESPAAVQQALTDSPAVPEIIADVTAQIDTGATPAATGEAAPVDTPPSA